MNERTVDLKEFAKIIVKRQRLILGVFLVFVLVVAIISFLIPPTYEAETTLRIKPAKGLGSSLLADLPLGSPTNTKQQMATYAEILKSRTVVQSVIDATQMDKPEQPAYEDFLKLITTQPVKDTEILKVKVQAKSPEEAQFVANTLVATFLERMTSLVRAEQAVVREFIGARLKEAKVELEQAENALERYKRDQKIIAPEEETRSMVDRLAAVNKLSADNAVGIASAEARLTNLRQQLASQAPGFIAESPLIQQYKSKLADLEVELVQLKQNFTDKHPRIVAVNAAIAETRARLSEETFRVVNAQASSMNPVYQGMLQARIQTEAEIVAAYAQKEAIRGVMAQSEQELVKLPGKEQGLFRLMRDALIAQEIFSMLAKRHEEARISEVMQPTDVQVVDVAVPPEKPIKPRIILNILLAAVLGLFIGTALSLCLEFMNRRVRTGDDVKHYLDLPVLGTIPDFANGRNLVKRDGMWDRLKVRFGL